MNQYPSLQAEPNEFEQKLSALNPNDLNQFIFSVFFEEVGAVESEGEAWDRTKDSGQGDKDYLIRMESEFQAKLQAIKRNSEILLEDANQRAREYVFQIRWWAQRLAEVERKSAERLAAVGGSVAPPPPPPQQPSSDPPTQTVPRQTPPPQPQPAVSSGSALDRLRAEFDGPPPPSAPNPTPEPAASPAESAPSPMDAERNALDNLRADLEGSGPSAQPAVPDDEATQLRARLEKLSFENDDMRRQLQNATGGGETAQALQLENEELKARLQFIDVEMEGLRKEAQKSESLTIQLENLRVQMEAERALAQSGMDAAPNQQELETQIEDLRNQLHAAQLETQAIKTPSDRETILSAQVESLTSQVLALEEGGSSEDQERQAQLLNDQIDELKGRLEIAQLQTEAQAGLASQLDALKTENEQLKKRTEQLDSSTEEIERLRTSIQEHESREASSQRNAADPKDISDAKSRVDRAQSQAIELANFLREPLIPIAVEIPVISDTEPWALNERANLLEHIFGEMERQRDEYFTPAQDTSAQILDRLREAGISTEMYEDALRVGNVNASLMMEGFLKALEQNQDTAPRSLNNSVRLLETLNDLELDVDEQLLDVHQRVVPTGLISIGRKLIAEYLDGDRPTDPQQTVRNIIRTIRGYLNSTDTK
ncbi:MAG: hypothetical protein QF878_16285 [SAR202 cluster bacterium]|nr:hypothetical protein [SAR202 cluster bacterium]